MILRFMQGDNTGKTVEVTGDNFTIGREDECDLLIDEDGISRLHCRISKMDEDYYVQDTESTNGIYVNGVKAEGRVKLKDNDKIRIGPQILLCTTGERVLGDDDLIQIEGSKKQQETVSPADPADTPVEEEADADSGREEFEQKAQPDRVKIVISRNTANVFLGVTVALLIIALANVVLGPKGGKKDKEENLIAAGDETDNIVQIDAGRPKNAPESNLPVVLENGDSTEVKTEPTPEEAPAPAAPVEPPKPKIPFNDLEKIAAYMFLSKPARAEVVIEGEVMGKTPLVLKDLKTGGGNVLLRKKGYQDLEATFEVPQTGQAPEYKLKQLPGTVLIDSKPSGASVMFGNQVLGETPWVVTEPQWAGKELTIRAVGYQPWGVTVELVPAKADQVTAKLLPIGGNLRIYTLPAAADIYVDGLAKVRSSKAEKGESSPVLLSNIKPGKHKIRIVMPDGSRSKTFSTTVAMGKTKTVRPTIYIPDTMVITNDEKIHEGMYRSTTPKGDIVLATSNKKKKVIKKAVISEVEPIEE